MTTLIEILTNGMTYDSNWAVYAEKIDGQFKPESQARFGQTQFENGGLLDSFSFFESNQGVLDWISNYLEVQPIDFPVEEYPEYYDDLGYFSQALYEENNAELIASGTKEAADNLIDTTNMMAGW